MRKVIYCFSGTGNNLEIARSLASQLGETDIFPMSRLKENKRIPEIYDWVGFITPAYYSHVPPLVKEAMADLRFSEHHKIFTIVGCGINRGAAHQDLRELIEKGNKQVQLEYMVSMPGSYIISYNGMSDWSIKLMLQLAHRKIHRIAKDMISDRHKVVSQYGLFYQDKKEQALKEKIAAFPSICAQYTVSEACIKCKTCIAVCPSQNIAFKEGKIVFGKDCQQCMACIQWCPQKAIDYKGLTHDRKHYHQPYISVNEMKAFQTKDK